MSEAPRDDRKGNENPSPEPPPSPENPNQTPASRPAPEPGKKKKEGWLGTVLTGLLCLGFLYYWFKPAKVSWDHQSTAQYVERAVAEPAGSASERLVLDFDLMETAILQARQGMAPEGVETAMRIADPVVQARAIRQLAQAHLNNDPKRMGDALTMCDRIADSVVRVRMREEILLQIAAMGFPDVALPEAKNLPLRARLARRLAETDGQATARDILKEIAAALPSLPPDEALVLQREAAWTRIGLSLSDGPQQAFAAIKILPPAEQGELWLELFRVCFGLGDQASAASAAVVAEVQDPALKRRLELEALESNMPLRPAKEILAELLAALQNAAPGVPHIEALMALADAQRRSSGTDADNAPNTLRMAYDSALALADPIQRATELTKLAELLPDSLLLAETTQALSTAAGAARTVSTPDQKLPLLILVMRQAFNTGELRLAAELASEAHRIAAGGGLSPQPDQLRELADFLIRIGDWQAGLSLLPQTASPEARAALLDDLASTAAEEAIGYDPSQPPNRGEPLDRIRNRAGTDETSAALWAQEQPAGPSRARAWLAIAKGQLLAPVPLPFNGSDLLSPNGNNLPMDSQDPNDLPTDPESPSTSGFPEESAPGQDGSGSSGSASPKKPAEPGAPAASTIPDPAPPLLPDAGELNPPLPEK